MDKQLLDALEFVRHLKSWLVLQNKKGEKSNTTTTNTLVSGDFLNN
jgi:hypothetical protein